MIKGLAAILMLTSLLMALGRLGPTESWAKDSLIPSTVEAEETTPLKRGTSLGDGVFSGVWTGGFWEPDYFIDKQVWGYVEKHSIEPGESFSLMLSTGPQFSQVEGAIEVYKIGPAEGGDRTLVWRSAQIIVKQQPVSNTAAAIGPNWVPTFSDIPTAEWKPGYYTIDFVSSANTHRDPDVAYVVVTNPKRSGDILLKLSTNTYQAYNSWGGHSFYVSNFVGNKGEMITFDRPTPPAFEEYEYYLVMWLETLAKEEGLTLDYATDFDIHADQNFTTGYKLVISGAHDEYWSKEEFDQFHQRIFKLGKNTMFMGGNSAYFQVRYADINRAPSGPSWGRQLICYKTMHDPIIRRIPTAQANAWVTARFREESRRPETMLAGVGFEAAFTPKNDDNPKFSYYVVNNHLPFFADTEYAIGDAIGDVVGYEWDNTDPNRDGFRLWDQTKSLIPSIDPQSITVLFSGNPMDDQGYKRKAESVYFISPAGGKVFNAGTIRWVWGLGKRGFVQEPFKRFNRNLVLYFLGRMN